MHKQRLVVLVLAVFGGIGSMGPWLTVLNTTVSGSKGDGWFAVLFLGIVLITVLFGGLKTSFGIVKVISHTVLSGLAAAVGIWTIYKIIDRLGEVSSDAWSVEWALPLLVVCSVAIPIAGYLMMEKQNTTSESSNL